MAKSEKRIKVHMKCPECGEKTYSTMKNKTNTPDKLELNKYCPKVRRHVLHKEVK